MTINHGSIRRTDLPNLYQTVSNSCKTASPDSLNMWASLSDKIPLDPFALKAARSVAQQIFNTLEEDVYNEGIEFLEGLSREISEINPSNPKEDAKNNLKIISFIANQNLKHIDIEAIQSEANKHQKTISLKPNPPSSSPKDATFS